MHLVFWQPIPSFHQENFLNKLAAASWIESVSLKYEKELPPEFKAFGWSLPEWKSVKVAPIQKDEVPADTSEHVHFFTGFWTHPEVWQAFDRLAMSRQCRVYAFAEAPALYGWKTLPRLLKYKLNSWHLKNRLDGLLAVGERGHQFYQTQLGLQCPVHKFAYYSLSHTEFTKSTESMAVKKDCVEFLYVGRLIYLKGLDRLFHAFAKTALDASHWRLTLVGEGPERRNLEKLAVSLGLGNQLVWIGAVAFADTRKYYCSTDYLIQPSRGDGWGMTVNEALSWGCDVIVSKSCGSADLADPERRLPKLTKVWPSILQKAFRAGKLSDVQRAINRSRATAVSAEAGVANLKEILRVEV